MIYGLYLSATGVLANSFQIDVASNNLANADTVGFKRDLALFRQRLTARQETQHAGDWSDPTLEKLGGGLAVNPNVVDPSQGELEDSGNPLDVAVQGNGYFAVQNGTDASLTRDGRFAIDKNGNLVLLNSKGSRLLDAQQKPIQLQPGKATDISTDGTVRQDGQKVASLGVFDVPDRGLLSKQGSGLLKYPNPGDLQAVSPQLQARSVERSNVDPTSELSQLMEAQRQLEANANMIRYQDETLQSLVNTVGKAT